MDRTKYILSLKMYSPKVCQYYNISISENVLSESVRFIMNFHLHTFSISSLRIFCSTAPNSNLSNLRSQLSYYTTLPFCQAVAGETKFMCCGRGTLKKKKHIPKRDGVKI